MTKLILLESILQQFMAAAGFRKGLQWARFESKRPSTWQCRHFSLFKLRVGVSMGKFVCLSVGLSFCGKNQKLQTSTNCPNVKS